MTALTPYTFPVTGEQVRTVLIDGEPWFVAADVTTILGYSNGRMAVGSLPERMKSSVTIPDGTPGNPNRTVISEPGVYRLVMRSNLMAAEQFQDWLAEDVIPSIRRTGSYGIPAEPRALSRLELIELARDAELGRLSELPSSHYHPRTGELVLDPPQVRVTVKGVADLRRVLGAKTLESV